MLRCSLFLQAGKSFDVCKVIEAKELVKCIKSWHGSGPFFHTIMNGAELSAIRYEQVCWAPSRPRVAQINSTFTVFKHSVSFVCTDVRVMHLL